MGGVGHQLCPRFVKYHDKKVLDMDKVLAQGQDTHVTILDTINVFRAANSDRHPANRNMGTD